MNEVLISFWPFCSFLTHVLHIVPQQCDPNLDEAARAEMRALEGHFPGTAQFMQAAAQFMQGPSQLMQGFGVQPQPGSRYFLRQHMHAFSRFPRASQEPFEEADELPHMNYESFLTFWFTEQQVDKLRKYYAVDVHTQELSQAYTVIEQSLFVDVNLSLSFVELLNMQQLLVFGNMRALPLHLLLTHFEQLWKAAFTGRSSKKQKKSDAELVQTLLDFSQKASSHPCLATRNFSRFTCLFSLTVLPKGIFLMGFRGAAPNEGLLSDSPQSRGLFGRDPIRKDVIIYPKFQSTYVTHLSGTFGNGF